MKRLNDLSVALTLAGLVAVTIGLLLELSPLVTLIGLMLIVAGGVKVLTVYLWRTMFDVDKPPSSSS